MNTALALSPPQYPKLYESARAALFRCEQIDECQEWANKAAAMAVYARQAKDDSLVIMAQRIQARAIRRVGELLKEQPIGTRIAAANAAGLTRLQRNQAASVAQIPSKKFERIVEGDCPKVYLLANIGRNSREKQHKSTEPKCCPTCGRPLEAA